MASWLGALQGACEASARPRGGAWEPTNSSDGEITAPTGRSQLRRGDHSAGSNLVGHRFGDDPERKRSHN
eukprot:4885290-Prymnesium_polylepis.1